MEKEYLEQFGQYLWGQEKSRNTVEKYMRDVRQFLNFLKGREADRELVLGYKEYLQGKYKTSSVNSMLIALNCFLRYMGKEEICVRTLKEQRRIFREEERELNKKEYERLVHEAKREGNPRLCCILQTVASTGIRIGELRYLTVEALKERKVRIDFKGKERIIFLPKALTVVLKDYCRSTGRKSGSIFVTKSGRPVDRRNVWAEMKRLCCGARVQATKVFPHNLRHLFARCFYERERDIMRLADYLGHSSVETTRRYTMISSTEVLEKQLDLGLLMMDTRRIAEGI